jgi:cell division protein FtsB
MLIMHISGAMTYLNNFGDWLKSRRIARKRNSLFLALLFFYFSFHLISGERGLLAYAKLKSEIDAKEQLKVKMQTEKETLANRVVGMRSENLDLDLLEEVARKDLGYSKKDEVIYFWE